MTDPGAFAFTSTEHDLVFAHILTTTTTTATSLTVVYPKRASRTSAPTSLDFYLGGHHVAAVL